MRKNRSRLRKLADAIEQKALPVRFNMKDYAAVHGLFIDLNVGAEIPCDTACCIAGWAVLLFGKPKDAVRHDSAERLLGLNGADADRLFLNLGDFISAKNDLHQITRREAVAAIRRMAEE